MCRCASSHAGLNKKPLPKKTRRESRSLSFKVVVLAFFPFAIDSFKRLTLRLAPDVLAPLLTAMKEVDLPTSSAADFHGAKTDKKPENKGPNDN